jgi:Uma2 family endonuclease
LIVAINPKIKLTPDEYLTFERAQTDARHEYLNGEVTMMAGASLEHNRIVSNLVATLHAQMRGRPCDVFSGDMRVHVSATGLYTYPDIAALCGEPHLEGDESDILLNPAVIMEVLSPSTEAYDRGIKFDHYRSIESLQTYVLIAQDRWQMEVFQRHDGGDWLLSVIKGPEARVGLSAIGCELVLADVYERVLQPQP